MSQWIDPSPGNVLANLPRLIFFNAYYPVKRKYYWFFNFFRVTCLSEQSLLNVTWTFTLDIHTWSPIASFLYRFFTFGKGWVIWRKLVTDVNSWFSQVIINYTLKFELLFWIFWQTWYQIMKVLRFCWRHHDIFCILSSV